MTRLMYLPAVTVGGWTYYSYMLHHFINDLPTLKTGSVIDSCLKTLNYLLVGFLFRRYTEYTSHAINKNEVERLANYCIDCAKSNKKTKERKVKQIDI
jgi:hypothetical protein